MADTPAPNSDKPEVNRNDTWHTGTFTPPNSDNPEVDRDDKGSVFSDLYGNKPPEAAPHTLGGHSEGDLKYHIHPNPNNPAPKYGIDSNGEAVGEDKVVSDKPMSEDTKYADSKLMVQVEFFKNLKRPFVVSEYGDRFKTHDFSHAFKPEDINAFEKLVSPFIITDSEFNTFTVGFELADTEKMKRLAKSRNQIDDILKAILPDSVRSPDPSEVIADRIRELASKAPYRQGFGRINRPLESGKLYRKPGKPNEQVVEIVVGPRILFGTLAVLGLYAAYKFGKSKAPR